MFTKSLAKSHDEFCGKSMDSYRNRFGGGYRMEEVADWIVDNELLPEQKINQRRIITRKLKQAAQRRRFRDPQGRTVRHTLAAKYKRIDGNGNMILDVVWDYLHEMSLDHALTSFSQRDENIEKQRLAATRDVHSVLDNNPNARGYGSQFRFGFMLEEPMPIVVETVEETSVSESLSKKKPK